MILSSNPGDSTVQLNQRQSARSLGCLFYPERHWRRLIKPEHNLFQLVRSSVQQRTLLLLLPLPALPFNDNNRFASNVEKQKMTALSDGTFERKGEKTQR
jgi:hypothetical protein